MIWTSIIFQSFLLMTQAYQVPNPCRLLDLCWEVMFNLLYLVPETLVVFVCIVLVHCSNIHPPRFCSQTMQQHSFLCQFSWFNYVSSNLFSIIIILCTWTFYCSNEMRDVKTICHPSQVVQCQCHFNISAFCLSLVYPESLDTARSLSCTRTRQPLVLCVSYTKSLQPCLQGISTRKPKSPLLSAHLAAKENFFKCKGCGATLTIKSASGCEVKGKEALREEKKKRFHFQGFHCVDLWVGDWWSMEGQREEGRWKKMEKRRKVGVVVRHKTSRCLSQGQVLALFLMNSFILFCWLFLQQQQKTVSWSVALNAPLQGLLSI